MSFLPTDPAVFASRAIDGFAASHPRHVQRVDGGVIRLAPMASGQVGLVVGGGSGHYPAFAGLVGAGMAAGAVCGNIFASPSAGQVVRVGSAVERGGGLLLAFGNYAGDVLHFSLGAERLRRQGIDVRIVTVTDDIASAGGELEPFWSAPADSPAYRRGSSITPPAGSQGGAQANPEPEVPSGSVNLTEPQRALLARFAAVEADLSQRVDELGALDAVAGDGDHGLGMLRGSQGAHAAVRSALARGCSTGEALMEAGEAWSDHGGGTSGALWGGGLLAAGQALAQAPGQNDPQQVVIAVGAALQAVRDLGQAALGDKTMLDALEPFQARLQGDLKARLGLEEALRNAADAAHAAAQATAELLPRLGRARPHGERSLGYPDPGALSLAYCLKAAIQDPGLTRGERPPAHGVGGQDRRS